MHWIIQLFLHTYFFFIFKVTWDYNSTNPSLVSNPSAFAQLPLKESDAIIDGFTLLTDCSG
jgi:hypothetical protein